MQILSIFHLNFKIALWLLVALLVAMGFYHTNKPMPEGLDYASEIYDVASSDIHFFSDVTYMTEEGRESDQEIFDEVLRMIGGAEHYILMDFFFYTNFKGVDGSVYRELSAELTQALIDKKDSHPDIAIQVTADPINIVYGGHRSEHFQALEEVGIPVNVVELTPLRDSNPGYSVLWRAFFKWFGNSSKEGFLANPFNKKSPDVGLRTYLKLLNFKADHRKVVMADAKVPGGRTLSTLITSANPHDGSSAHGNIAVRVDSFIWQDVLQSEAAVAHMSEQSFIQPPQALLADMVAGAEGEVRVQYLTEESIEDRILRELRLAGEGDTIDIAMFYIADREIMAALTAADARGATLRLLFDSNKDAFGREKNGSPNREVAHELMTNSSGNTTIRWCNTHGEQCHSKLLIVRKGDSVDLIQGSANYTRRNLDNYNLETNIALSGDQNVTVFKEAQAFFDKRWNNENGIEHSVSYETYTEESKARSLNYRIKEFTGLSHW